MHVVSHKKFNCITKTHLDPCFEIFLWLPWKSTFKGSQDKIHCIQTISKWKIIRRFEINGNNTNQAHAWLVWFPLISNVWMIFHLDMVWMQWILCSLPFKVDFFGRHEKIFKLWIQMSFCNAIKFFYVLQHAWILLYLSSFLTSIATTFWLPLLPLFWLPFHSIEFK